MDQTTRPPVEPGSPSEHAMAGQPEPLESVRSEDSPQPATFIPLAPVERLAPTSARDRLPMIDVLRGFALFGILAINILSFSAPYLSEFSAPPPALTDRIALSLLRLFVELKFYTLFSFLFGLGFSLQMERAWARGVDPLPVFRRRLFVLLGIGLIHAVFIWSGDILVMYAVLGFFLPRFLRTPPERLPLYAAVGIAIPTVLTGLGSLAGMAFGGSDAGESMSWYTDRAMSAYAHGSYGDMVGQRLIELGFMYAAGIILAPHVLAMFVLGLFAGRWGIFYDVEAHVPLLRRVVLVGLPLGLALSGLYAAGQWAGEGEAISGLEALGQTGVIPGATTLSMAYAAGIVLLLRRNVWRRRLAPLASVGRMALSNYLLQSLIGTTLFYNYGLDLYGRVGVAEALSMAVVIYALQVPLSVWWMRHFAFGPAEWLWRSLTYGARQPMRRTS